MSVINVPGSLTFPIVIIKTIVKARDPGDEVENKVTNSQNLNSEIFFWQAFYNFASFLLVLDLMRELYVILFPEVFHFLI